MPQLPASDKLSLEQLSVSKIFTAISSIFFTVTDPADYIFSHLVCYVTNLATKTLLSY